MLKLLWICCVLFVTTIAVKLTEEKANIFKQYTKDYDGACSRREFCFLSSQNYTFFKYRTPNGECNNLFYTNWGKAGTYASEFPPPQQSDYFDIDASACSNGKKPNCVDLRNKLIPIGDKTDCRLNIMGLFWLQSAAHDMIASANNPPGEDCCGNTDGKATKNCFSLKYEEGKCQSFPRTKTSPNSVNYAKSGATSYIDLDHIYGNSDAVASSSRQMIGGLLKCTGFENKEFMITCNSTPQSGCNANCENCYKTEPRGNQNPPITLVATVLLRMHNFCCRKLANINTAWNDEILYQECRKIVVGWTQFQQFYKIGGIVFGLSEEDLEEIIRGYSPMTHPSTMELASLCWKILGHTMTPNHIDLWKDDQKYGEMLLKDEMRCPTFISDESNLQALAMGMMRQPVLQCGPQISSFIAGDVDFGSGNVGDQFALDCERSREHLLPRYRDIFEMVHQMEMKENLINLMNKDKIEQLEAAYDCPDDIDALFGLTYEDSDHILGLTCSLIMQYQWRKWGEGDRFWFDEYGFSERQIEALKSVTMSGMMCSVLQLSSVPKDGLLPDCAPNNSIVNCNDIDGTFEGMDWEAWKKNK